MYFLFKATIPCNFTFLKGEKILDPDKVIQTSVGTDIRRSMLIFVERMTTLKCLNCDQALKEAYSFCPNCGQETQMDGSLKTFILHFLGDYFTFDSKIIRSFTPLITKPGYLTREYFQGRRVRYIPPLRLFIFLSIIFFLFLNWLKVESSNHTQVLTGEDQSWNNYFESWLPKLFFILLPLFALLLSLLYRKQQKGFIIHFVFALHYHATLFLVGILYSIISYCFFIGNLLFLNSFLLICAGAYLLIYLFLAQRKMYGQALGKTFVKFLLLFASYTILLIASSFLLLLLSFNA
jgi:hypothetical protein